MDLDFLGLMAARRSPPLAELYYVDERVLISLPDQSAREYVITRRRPTASGLELTVEPA